MAKLIFVLFSLALCATNAASESAPQPAILNGNPTLSGQFPSVVAITSTVGQLNCLGNVINELHVLTAASCVLTNNQLVNPFWLTITGGDLVLNVATIRRVERNVTHIYPHAQFNTVSHVNNLAVLRVGARFPFPHNTIEAARIPTRPIANDIVCRFAGWSAATAAANAQITPVQTYINVPINAAAVCTTHLPANALVESTFCGGSILPNNPSPCNGAVGGGLYCGPDNELFGILSLNTACGVANQPSLYIEVRRHTAWINQQFTRVVRFAPGTTLAQTA